jgi:hypothetical protein
VSGAASAALIAGAVHRGSLAHGLSTATARTQGTGMILPIVLACAGVALAQVAIGLAARHGPRPRALTISVPQARWALAAAIVVVIVTALALRGPSHLSHAWTDFKQSRSAALGQDNLQRFGTLSGNGRYDYWAAALDSTSNGHLVQGNGPGSFQLLWLPRASFFSYVQNAHSLYLETIAEVGLVGLVLLVGFFVLVIVRGIWLVLRSHDDARARAAAVTAALLAFAVSAGSDWIWQVPALPVAFLLLAAAILAPSSASSVRVSEPVPVSSRRPSGLPAIATRTAIIVLALACVAAIAVPLAYTAARIESGAASPQIQIALVLEAQGKRGSALAHADEAVRDEPDNWSSWLILSRLSAETGHPARSLYAYRQARHLNPRSPVFSG